jgi:hypothetical protein
MPAVQDASKKLIFRALYRPRKIREWLDFSVLSS